MTAPADRPGAAVVDGGVRFEVWSPSAARIDVVVDPDGTRRVVPLHRSAPAADGSAGDRWSAVVPDIGAGTRYRIRLDGGDELADPASRHQPDGVFGPSAVVDPAQWVWTDASWRGVGLHETVLSELHVGTFTPEGTLAAAAAGDRLAAMAELGVTTIELMPLAQFSGARGWGYDGVFPNAVQHSYGGPDAMAAFVDAAHQAGLAVVVDVVYNHFGPEGWVAHRFGPYTTPTSTTPWGGAVNVADAGSDEVRRFFLDNARMWIEDFHADGLRLDAVHAIHDPTARPFLEELVEEVHRIGRDQGRVVLTFLESSANDPRLVTPPPNGIGGDAMWNDELHHAVRVALTGDRSGYYVDFTGAADVADVLEHRFAYRGRYSAARGRRHGRDVSHLDPACFVVCDQNHDQIGNRRGGERLDVLVGPDRRRLALAAVLLSPFTPLLFMGEEYGDPAPFPFFVDFHDPALLDAVRTGRAEEFAGFEWETDPPDPADPATHRSAILSPALAAVEPHASLRALCRELLTARRDHPVLTDTGAAVTVALDGTLVTMHRRNAGGEALVVLNFGAAAAEVALGECVPTVDTADPRWGSPGTAARPTTRPPWSALLATR